MVSPCWARDELAPLPYRELRSLCARSTRLLLQNECCQGLLGADLKSPWSRPLGLATNSLHSLIASCAHSALVPLGRSTARKAQDRSGGAGRKYRQASLMAKHWRIMFSTARWQKFKGGVPRTSLEFQTPSAAAETYLRTARLRARTLGITHGSCFAI